jgi:uncharacterized protein (TIGR02466 family)
MKPVELKSLFPVPMYLFQMDRKFMNIEKEFIEQQKNSLRDNTYNKTSINNYVLNDKKLTLLKSEIEGAIKRYCLEVLTISSEVYITQSWLNYTTKNESHHKHYHPNSFISGVLYIDAMENKDSINFCNRNFFPIKGKMMENSNFDNDYFKQYVSTGQLILFPSMLEHFVDLKTEENHTRISLAFNTFLKGIVGENENLTELNLK